MSEMTKDEAAVDRALDRFILTDAGARKLKRNVLRAQRALREAVSKKVWQLYLALEEAVNARDLNIIEQAIKLGLKQGRKRS
jgi:hypothetical protein